MSRRPITSLRLDRVDPTAFWANVEHDDTSPDACWYWVGPGIRWVGEAGTLVRGGMSMAPYRIAFALTCGEPPDDQEVHHTCRQRGCCRPSHLVALTLEEHRVVHRGGIVTALIRAFGAELPTWSFFEILDTEMLCRSGYR